LLDYNIKFYRLTKQGRGMLRNSLWIFTPRATEVTIRLLCMLTNGNLIWVQHIYALRLWIRCTYIPTLALVPALCAGYTTVWEQSFKHCTIFALQQAPLNYIRAILQVNWNDMKHASTPAELQWLAQPYHAENTSSHLITKLVGSAKLRQL